MVVASLVGGSVAVWPVDEASVLPVPEPGLLMAVTCGGSVVFYPDFAQH